MTRPRALLLLAAAALPACAGRGLSAFPPAFPMTAAWKTLLGDFVEPPLAADARKVFAATRDGRIHALEATTGATVWTVRDLRGRLAASSETLLVRSADGLVTSLRPDTGAAVWTTQTTIAGELPAVIDGGRVLVAGRGLALLDGTSGQVLWRDTTGPEATALPAVVGSRAFVGEADGTLRCRDVATGATRWTFRTRSALEATPLVDLARGRVYLGTTDRRILALDLERGRPAWTWRVGADVRVSGILLDRRVVFAPLDAALYALHLGGNVAWRASLPSRPLSAPLLVDGTLLVACYEDEIVGIDAASGRSVGTLRTAAEIRTAPLLVGRRLVVGLRDRSVVAYALPGETIAP